MRLVSLVVLLSIAGCGDGGAPADKPPPAPGARITSVDVARENWPAKCPDANQIVSAICFADPGRSLSASGPLFLKQDDGSFAVECMTGGSNVRLFCLGQ